MVTYPLRPCPSCDASAAFRFNLDELPLDRPNSSVQCPACQLPVLLLDLKFSQPSQIFISYNWGDKKHASGGKYDNQEKVKELKSAIEKQKQLTCWMDLEEMEGGDHLENKMRDGIAGAAVVVLVLTPKYVCSDNCMREFNWARGMKKKIIVVITHPYATARRKSDWSSDKDKTDGGLEKTLDEAQRGMLKDIVETYNYFDITTEAKWSKYLPDFLQKLQEEVNIASSAARSQPADEARAEKRSMSSSRPLSPLPLTSGFARPLQPSEGEEKRDTQSLARERPVQAAQSGGGDAVPGADDEESLTAFFARINLAGKGLEGLCEHIGIEGVDFFEDFSVSCQN